VKLANSGLSGDLSPSVLTDLVRLTSGRIVEGISLGLILMRRLGTRRVPRLAVGSDGARFAAFGFSPKAIGLTVGDFRDDWR